ncbi:MAG: TIGR04438 family Trp-rich protein [Burkholderiaceae bacterium]|nr:TIGR04438 family Trp-rich protein [Burkholderiaceae bacterium]
MILIILIVALAALRFFEVGFIANLSWWWIGGLFGVAFLWFEFGEKLFGFDRRGADEALEKKRKERVERTFGKK